MSVVALKPRKLPSWIGSFEDATEHLHAPLLFRRWAGICTLAGVLERKTWVQARGSKLYPNLYTIFVAPPGIGKSLTLSLVEIFWRNLTGLHVAPTSLTKAALIDALAGAGRQIVRPGLVPPFVEFNSLLVVASELGVLLPAYENDFMNTLTNIYDGYQYEERRRSKDIHLTIEHPQINLVGATTPSYLNTFMPMGAWDQGFISRTLLIFSGELIRGDLFDVREGDNNMLSALQADLKSISTYFGEFDIDDETRTALNNWHRLGGPPVPEHPKLAHYCTRRTAHLLKLCMVAAVSTGSDLLITIEHYRTALAWLLEAEEAMPDIFRAMKGGGDASAMDEAWHFLFQIYAKSKKPVNEAMLYQFLRERVPSYAIEKIIDTMVKSGMARRTQEPTTGMNVYTPAARQPNV